MEIEKKTFIMKNLISIVIAMVKHFESQGKTVGVVSRGYKGNYSDEILEVTSATTPQECGDEPALIAQNTNAKIVVAKKRSKTAPFRLGPGRSTGAACVGISGSRKNGRPRFIWRSRNLRNGDAGF